MGQFPESEREVSGKQIPLACEAREVEADRIVWLSTATMTENRNMFLSPKNIRFLEIFGDSRRPIFPTVFITMNTVNRLSAGRTRCGRLATVDQLTGASQLTRK
jgi:hypothetical protein